MTPTAERPTRERILPDGRLIPYDYGTENSIDDVLNRVASIHDDATLEVLAEFGYLGAAMPAITTLPTPALQRRWRKLPGTPDGESDAGLADGGDPYCPRSQTRDDLQDGFAYNEPLIAAKQCLRLVHDQNNVPIQDNRYDGLTRRTQEITSAGARHFMLTRPPRLAVSPFGLRSRSAPCVQNTSDPSEFFNDQWRSVEERIDTATTPERQHIWNPRDRWVLVFRDRSAENNGTLDERLWCLKDDIDPVAVADTNGAIVERYGYSAFGIVTTLTPGFDPRQDNQSDFDWNLLFHAEFEDVVTEWMNYGYRYFVPLLGRWLRRDPITEGGGRNLYVFAENDGIGVYDVLGLRRPRDPRGGIPIQPTPQPRPSAPRNDPAISDTQKTLKRLFDFFEQKNEAQAQMIEATIYAKAEAICQELYEAHDDPALPECGCCVYTLVVTLRYPGRPAGRLIPSTPTNGPVVRVHKVDLAYVPVECDEADRGGIPRNLMAARQTEIIKRRPQ